MSIFKTKTVKGGKNTEIEMDIFYLNQIPDAMEKIGWKTAPQLMRHWFKAEPASNFTIETKKQYIDGDAVKIPKNQVNIDIVKMGWALDYTQVKDKVVKLQHEWASLAGLKLLKKS